MTNDAETDMLHITESLHIRRAEFAFRFSRSSGPGGQNLNKLNTRVTLRFDVAASPSLTEAQRKRLSQRLRTRITRRGILQIVSAKHRTQAANRRAATERFVELLGDALKPTKRRKRTAIPRRSRAHRLENKTHRSETKRLRDRPTRDE